MSFSPPDRTELETAPSVWRVAAEPALTHVDSAFDGFSAGTGEGALQSRYDNILGHSDHLKTNSSVFNVGELFDDVVDLVEPYREYAGKRR